jgi:hypothetical protein
MTFGQSLGFALIWQKLRGIEKNTRGVENPKTSNRLEPISAEEFKEYPDRFIGICCLVLLALLIACIVSFIFSALIPGGVFGALFILIIRAVFFRVASTDTPPEPAPHD